MTIATKIPDETQMIGDQLSEPEGENQPDAYISDDELKRIGTILVEVTDITLPNKLQRTG